MSTANQPSNPQRPPANTSSSFFDFSPISLPSSTPGRDESADSGPSGGQGPSSQTGGQPILASNNPYFQHATKAGSSPHGSSPGFNAGPTAPPTSGGESQNIFQDMFSPLHADANTVSSTTFGQARGRSSPAKRTSTFFPKATEQSVDSHTSAQEGQPTLVDVSLPPPGTSNQSFSQSFPSSSASPAQRSLSNDNSASLSTSSNSWGRGDSSFTSNNSSDLAALGSSGIGDSMDDHQSPPATFVGLPSGTAPGERKPGLGRTESGKAGVIARPTNAAETSKANVDSQTNNQSSSPSDGVTGQSWNIESSSQSQRTDPDSSSDGRKAQTPLSATSSAPTTTGSLSLFGQSTHGQGPKAKPTPPAQQDSPASNHLSSHGSSPNTSGPFRPLPPVLASQAPPKQDQKLDPRLEVPSPAPTPYLPHGVPPPAPSAPPLPDNHEYPLPFLGSGRFGGGISGMRSWGGPLSAVPSRFTDNRRPMGGDLSGRDGSGISPPVGTIGSGPQHGLTRGTLGASLAGAGGYGFPGKSNNENLPAGKSGQSGGLPPIGSGTSKMSSTSYELPRPPSILYPDPIPWEYRPSERQSKRLASIDESIPEDRAPGGDMGISPTTSSTRGPGVGGGLGLSFPSGSGIGDGGSKGGQYSPRHRNLPPRLSQAQMLGSNIGTRESVMRGQWVGGTMAMPTSTNASNSSGGMELGQSQPNTIMGGRERSESSGYPVYLPQQQGSGISGRDLKETYRFSQGQPLGTQPRSELSTMQMQLQQAEEQQQRVRQRQMQLQQQQQQQQQHQQQTAASYGAKRPGLTNRPFSFDETKPDEGQQTREISQRQGFNYNMQPLRDDHGSPAGSAGSRRRVSNASGGGQRTSLDLKTPDLPVLHTRNSSGRANEEDAIASLADLYPTLPTSHVQSLHSFALYLQEDALTAERGEKLKAGQVTGGVSGVKKGFDESRLSALGISRMKRWDEWKELEEVERKRVIALISPGIAISSSATKRRSTGGASEGSSSGGSMEETRTQRPHGLKGGQSGGKTNESSTRTTPSTTPNVTKNPFTPTDYDEGEMMQPLPPPLGMPDLTDMDSPPQQAGGRDYRRTGDEDDDDDDDDDDDSETRDFYPSRRQRQAAAEAAAKATIAKNEGAGQAGPPSPTPTDLQVAAAPKVDLELQMPRPLPSVPATRIDPSARRRLIDEESVAGTESRASTRDESGQDGPTAAFYHPDRQAGMKKVDVDTRQLSSVVNSFSRRNASSNIAGGNGRSGAPQQPMTEIPPFLRQAYSALEIATNSPSLENFLAETRRILDGKTSILVNAFSNDSGARRRANQTQAAALMNTGRLSYSDIERLGEEFEKEEARRKLELDKEVYLLFENTFVEVSYKEVKAQLDVLGRKWYEDVKNWLFGAVTAAVGSNQQSGNGTSTEYHLILESVDLLNKLHLAMEEHEHVLQNLVSERNSRYLQISVSPLLAVGDNIRAAEAERRFWADEQERQLIAKMEAQKRAKDHANIVERIDSELIRGLKRKFDEVVQEVNGVVDQFPSQVLPELFRRFFGFDLKGNVVVNMMEEGFLVPPNAIASLGDSVQALSEIVSLVKLALDFQNDPQVKLCEATCSLQVTENHAQNQGITSPAITAAACSSALATLMPSALKRLTEEQTQRASQAQDELLDILRNLRSMVAAFEKNPRLPAVTVRPPEAGGNGDGNGAYQPHQQQQQHQQPQQHQQHSSPQQGGYSGSSDSPQYSAGVYDSSDPGARWGQVKQGHGRENMPNLASVIGSFKARRDFLVIDEVGRWEQREEEMGGGPAGLVAAATLFRSHAPGTFQPTIFEASSSVGGMWPCEADGDRPHTVYGHMPTNLSKYTVNFSGLAWESVGDIGQGREHGGAPMFPKAWQVGRYLAAYSKKHGLESCVRLDCRVTSAVRGVFGDGKRWRVKWEKGYNGDAVRTPELASEDFHFLVVASGFFSRRFETGIEGLDVRTREKLHVTHTSEIKGIGELLHAIERKAKGVVSPDSTGKIVVVGGSMSGAEAAASLALELSSEKYSPPSCNKRIGDYAVYQVSPRPFWVLPPMTPKDPFVPPVSGASGDASSPNPAPAFLPLDLCLYDLSRLPLGEIRKAPLVATPERAMLMNSYLGSLVGGNQSDLRSDALTMGPDMAQKPPWVAVSENYASFVRDGKISVRRGRVKRVSIEEASGKVSVMLSGGVVLENVVALVLATGYRPQPSLGFLEPGVLDSLGYKPDNTFLPLLLEKHSTIHPSLPDLGFVGFYRGAYWGVMEMQSRLLGKLWAGGKDDSMHLLSASPEESLEIQAMQALRDSEAEKGQWPMGDYVGVMEEFSRDLGIPRCGLWDGAGERVGPVVPARYAPEGLSRETQVTISSLNRTLQGARASSPSFVARATFSALQGTWEFSRTLKSAIPTFPSGTFIGRASFHPRLPTGDGSDGEYLYTEEGEFITDGGLKLKGSRRYVWRYKEEGDKISVWFVKSHDALSVDYFFHELEFFGRGTDASSGDGRGFDDEDGGWAARGHHLCEEDNYTSRYRFVFGGTTLRRFGVRYVVVGPKKDYWTETWYRR